MTLPNFLIIGAPKAGTTSLYSYFREHPAIFMPELKEPRFFGYEGQGDRIRFPVRTLEEYTALFDAVTTETAIGEATPHYLVYPVAAQRIRDLIPEVRLIASLRDPVDRAYSVYQMNLRNKGVNTGIPFVEAIRTDHNLRETYADMLGRYVALFPPEQLKVILLEDLEADPQRDGARALRVPRRRPRLRARPLEDRQSGRRAAQQAPARAPLRPAAPGDEPRRCCRAGWSTGSGSCAAATSRSSRSSPRTGAPRSASSATTSCAPRI